MKTRAEILDRIEFLFDVAQRLSGHARVRLEAKIEALQWVLGRED